jgi:signal transduction histidine kinase/DNA-binding response OmpR family regulator
LQPFTPVLLVLTTADGQISASEVFGPNLDEAEALRLTAEVLPRLRTQGAVSFPYPRFPEAWTAFGVKLTSDTFGAVLAGLCRLDRGVRFPLDELEPILRTCGRLVWKTLTAESERHQTTARLHQLRREMETLRQAHQRLIQEMAEEQHKRLAEAREYARRLEQEVELRSHALQEAAEQARQQSEQLQQYATALEQALLAHEELTRAAEAANRAKSEFLASISHEVRTPLTAILGHADLLADQLPQGSSAARSVEVIRRNGRHLLAILNDLLDLAKAEAGRLEIELTPCCPADLLEQVRQLMEIRAAEKSLPLVLETENLPRGILTDPVRLKQILTNLVGNAIKFTERGRITIRAKFEPEQENRGQLVLEVIDTGIGIAPEVLQRLFRPFEQGHSSISRRYGGTGLGLAICKRLTEMLGGRIEAESTLHVGSTFRVILPVQISTEVPHSERENEPLPTVTSPLPQLQGRVLLVDDSPDNRLILQRILELAGAEVVLATNGREAVEILLSPIKLLRPEASILQDVYAPPMATTQCALDVRGAVVAAVALPEPPSSEMPQPHFDLVLMDLQMPEMDGFAATRLLRSHGCNVPIIALTANASTEDREECLNAGFDGFISKPVDRIQFLREVARFIGRED